MEQWEVMEVLWTTYPPAATKLNVRHSRWVRPMSKGTEAWTMLGMSQSPHKMKHEMSENVGEIQGRIQEFQNGEGGSRRGRILRSKVCFDAPSHILFFVRRVVNNIHIVNTAC